MKELDIILEQDGSELKLYFHPESLVLITFDLKEDGLSDSEIAEYIENLKASILEDYKQKIASGEIDEDAFEDADYTGCGDPSCPNCGTDVVYH